MDAPAAAGRGLRPESESDGGGGRLQSNSRLPARIPGALRTELDLTGADLHEPQEHEPQASEQEPQWPGGGYRNGGSIRVRYGANFRILMKVYYEQA